MSETLQDFYWQVASRGSLDPHQINVASEWIFEALVFESTGINWLDF